MNKMQMSESTSHFTFLAAWGLGMFAALASLVLGTRQAPGEAMLFLALAVVACVISWIARTRYLMLRGLRWQHELANTENELNQLLNHTRMNIIVDHITGPLRAEMVSADEGGGIEEEGPVAKS